MCRDRIADYRIMNINFYPRESQLVTFRDPWSFPVLYHPSCNNLIRKHLQDLAQKVRLCVSPQLPDPWLTYSEGCLALCLPGRIPSHSILSATVSLA